MNIFLAKSTNQSPEQQFNLKVPDGQMEASCSFFNNTAPVWYRNTLIHNSPYCANCHLNSERAVLISLLFSSYIFHPISGSGCEQSCRPSNERQCLQQSLGHLPLLWGESLSGPCVCPLQTMATGYEPASAVRWALGIQGGNCSTGRNLLRGNRWRLGGICWRWVVQRREVCGPPQALQMMLLLEAKQPSFGKNDCL